MTVRNGHAKRCHCPLCITADAALLLDRGKASMAARLLADLPAAIVTAVEAAHAKGVKEGRAISGSRRPARKPSAPAPSSARSHQALAAALAEGRITVERAAELLRVGPREVEQIAAGKVGLAPSAWKRLLRGLQG
jgi:hypothetical protein